MMQIGLIAIGAGAAAALLFASVASGSVLALLLFSLAPLPIAIASLGWNHWAGLFAALGAAVVLAFIFDGTVFLSFLIGVGLPAWWLGYLAMLARPFETEAGTVLEWYPPGRLVLWAAILGAIVVVVAIPTFGTDDETFRSGMRRGLERVIRGQMGIPKDAPLVIPGISDPEKFLDLLTVITPMTAAVLVTITNVVNIWLAGKVVAFSGRLRRPWPDLRALRLPALSAAGLAAALAASFIGGLPGIAGGVFSASLLMAFAVLGFAVLHSITRGIDARAFVLAGIYAAVLVFGWPVLALALLGLSEIAFDIRARIARRRGPPAPTS